MGRPLRDAFGVIEAAVVVYLRAIFYPDGSAVLVLREPPGRPVRQALAAPNGARES